MEEQQKINNNTEQPKDSRECGMMTTVGFQGSGKTYQNKIIIGNYIKDKIETKIKGRKFLILDSNGEYTEIDGKPVRKLAVKDVIAWCHSNVVEVRRIDMKSLSIDEKLQVLEYVLQKARNCGVCVEDVNTIALDMSQMKNVVSCLVNLRHKAVDVLISYQSLRAVEPRILANSRWFRIHYFSGATEDVKGKLNEEELFKLAQLIINKRYFGGDKRFFLYVDSAPPKLRGNFTIQEFRDACKTLLLSNKRKIKDQMSSSGCSQEEAIKQQTDLLMQQFYGNKKITKK